MKRIVLLMVVVLLSPGSLGLAQQRQRIFIVRDDDGTPDWGRGHVSTPASVCLKVLKVKLHPATVTQARIMYYMKHNPYDTATKTLYSAAAEGVKWSKLVVTLNGREVLRESLIEHGTMGWHEIPIDPALLRRGENKITITLDGMWGTLDHLGQSPHDLRFPFWEYQFGHWVKLLLWTAQRHTARLASVPVLPSWERLLEARLAIGWGGEATLQRAYRLFLRPQGVVLDDYISVACTHSNQEAPTYCWRVYSRHYDDMGMKAHYPDSIFWSSLQAGFSTGVAFGLTSVGSPGTGPGGERIPCLHDPQMWAQEEQAIRSLGRHYKTFSPLMLGLGDEMAVNHYDEVCFSKHTLAAFRKYLRQRYGRLDKLNATWQTRFAAWDAVVPWKVEQARKRPRNIAPWLEFRVFMTHTFVQSLVKMQRWVKEEAPGAHTGGANPLDESYTSCAVFSRIYPVLEYAQVYPRFHDRARSWFRDPRLVGLWSGYNYPRAKIEHHAWLLPTYGGTLMCWFGSGRAYDYRTLTNTLNPGERAGVIGDCNRELQAGIGKLLIAAEVEPQPVAILSSYRGKFAYTALKASQTPKQNPTGWDREFDEFLQGYSSLLRKLRVPYRFVDEDQVEQGVLDRYALVIAPQVSVLSRAAVDRLKTFARRQPLIADRSLGTYDEHGRKRNVAPFDFAAPGDLKLADFGDRPLRVSGNNLARLRQLVEAAGIEPIREVDGEGIDFIVRKRLGDLRLLVLFGRGELTVSPPRGTIAYDARAHRLLGPGPATITPERGPAVLVFAPRAVDGLTLSATAAVKRGQQADFQVRVRPHIETVVRLRATGPEGKPRPWYNVNVTVKDGRGVAAFRPALNDPLGQWKFVATDVISGATAAASLSVRE